MKFKTLYQDASYSKKIGKFIGPKLNNGEFDYWLVIETIDMHEASGETDCAKYYAQICVVSPSEAGETQVSKAVESCGIECEALTDEMKVEVLQSYGVSACVWQSTGNNLAKLDKAARKEARLVKMLFGFYMDKALNRIGSTGWEFMRGDLNSGLARAMSSGTPEGNILAKMHGVK